MIVRVSGKTVIAGVNIVEDIRLDDQSRPRFAVVPRRRDCHDVADCRNPAQCIQRQKRPAVE